MILLQPSFGNDNQSLRWRLLLSSLHILAESKLHVFVVVDTFLYLMIMNDNGEW